MEKVIINKEIKQILWFISKPAQMIYAKMVAQRRYYILSLHDCFIVYFDSEMEVISFSLGFFVVPSGTVLSWFL